MRDHRFYVCVGVFLFLCGCEKHAREQLQAHLTPKAHARSPQPKHPLAKQTRHAPPPLRQMRICALQPQRWSWYQKAFLTTDRTSFRRMFRRQHYRLPHPTRTLLMAARIIQGVGQPAFQYYSLDNTGFRYSHSKREPHWWPASCVKPWAIVGALMTLHKYGLDGRTKLVFRDHYGTFRGTVHDLYANITNQHYDRMMMIAGLDSLNGPIWRKRYSLPNMVLQRAYGGIRSLRYSPRITYYHKGRRGVIPARYAKLRFKRCRSNCTTLFELQDVLRRIALHHELPKQARFPISDYDQRHIMKRFLRIPNKMGRAFRQVWGRRTKGYNKSGSARGWDQIENVFIVPQHSKYRYLIAGSVPWWRKDEMADPSLLILNELGRQAMLALKHLPKQRVSLQLDAGLPMQVWLYRQHPSDRDIHVLVKGPKLTALRAWEQLRPIHLKQHKPGLFHGILRGLKPGKHLLILKGYQGKQAVSYRSLGFSLGKQPAPCKLTHIPATFP